MSTSTRTPAATRPAGMSADPLTALDRCDAPAVVMTAGGTLTRGGCGAQAYVRVVLAAGTDLLFCAHHYDERAAALAVVGVAVFDTRPAGIR